MKLTCALKSQQILLSHTPC
uniref:Uncharacterized protein n=1 Tax=Arundo donax TaxID=35708 RepID=A0A0A8YRQ5_ARUDO